VRVIRILIMNATDLTVQDQGRPGRQIQTALHWVDMLEVTRILRLE
jgi:hypothetical protein